MSTDSSVTMMGVDETGEHLRSRLLGKAYPKCVIDFENRIQYKYSKGVKTWEIGVDIAKDLPAADIRTKIMSFSKEELENVFELVITLIEKLIEEQIKALQLVQVDLR